MAFCFLKVTWDHKPPTCSRLHPSQTGTFEGASIARELKVTLQVSPEPREAEEDDLQESTHPRQEVHSA